MADAPLSLTHRLRHLIGMPHGITPSLRFYLLRHRSRLADCSVLLLCLLLSLGGYWEGVAAALATAAFMRTGYNKAEIRSTAVGTEPPEVRCAAVNTEDKQVKSTATLTDPPAVRSISMGTDLDARNCTVAKIQKKQVAVHVPRDGMLTRAPQGAVFTCRLKLTRAAFGEYSSADVSTTTPYTSPWWIRDNDPFTWQTSCYLINRRRDVRIDIGPYFVKAKRGIGASCFEAKCTLQFRICYAPKTEVDKATHKDFVFKRGNAACSQTFTQAEICNAASIDIHIDVFHHNAVKERDEISFSHVHPLADVCLVAEQTEFWVSRQLLSVASPFFDQLFFGSYAENGKKKVQFNETKSNTDLLLKAVYAGLTGHTLDVIQSHEKEIDTLLELADKYLLSGVAYHCELLLRKETGLTTERLMQRLDTAVVFKLAGVQEHLVRQVTRAIVVEMMDLPGWECIHGDTSRLLLKFMADDAKANTP